MCVTRSTEEVIVLSFPPGKSFRSTTVQRRRLTGHRTVAAKSLAPPGQSSSDRDRSSAPRPNIWRYSS